MVYIKKLECCDIKINKMLKSHTENKEEIKVVTIS